GTRPFQAPALTGRAPRLERQSRWRVRALFVEESDGSVHGPQSRIPPRRQDARADETQPTAHTPSDHHQGRQTAARLWDQARADDLTSILRGPRASSD